MLAFRLENHCHDLFRTIDTR